MIRKMLLTLGVSMLLFGGGSAARADGSASDYARLSVPDVDQARTFFADMLGCVPLGASNQANPDSAMMECAQGTVIELVRARHPVHSLQRIALRAEHPRAVAAWLRRRHLSSVGATVVRPLDRDSGRVSVDLVTPWGQPLQLVGHTVVAAHPAQLAAE